MIGHAAWALVRWGVWGSRRGPARGRLARRWQEVSGIQGRGARRMLRLLGWEVAVREGVDGHCWDAGGRPGSVADVPTNAPVLVVANHIGALDPWILAAIFDCSFVGKSEIARWPIVGFVGRAAGLILAHRQRKLKTTRMVHEVRARMQAGVPVAIFPEGTTSDGRALLPFKTGGFAALVDKGGSRDGPDPGETGFVLPVYFHITHIDGQEATETEKTSLTWHGGEELWSWLWRVTRHKLRWGVAIGVPIPARGHTRKSLGQAAQHAVETLRTTKTHDRSASTC